MLTSPAAPAASLAAEEQVVVDPIEQMAILADEELLNTLVAMYLGGPAPAVVPEHADNRRMVALLTAWQCEVDFDP